jgi:topoisomerase IA-like protein
MYEIDPTRMDLAEEFHRKPYGRHSAELQRILNRMRTEPFEGHYVLLRDGRFGPYRLGQLGATPADPITPTGQVFKSVREAEWVVFKLRWKRLTGQDLALD